MILPKSIFFTITFALYSSFLHAQKVKVATIGFYNLENLFDTVDDTLINDEEFLPTGGNVWTVEKYQEKLTNMAYVISKIGIEVAPAGLSILGVAEIENRKVLNDLVAQPTIASRNYKIIHYDSPDSRGIDVALLYNPNHFTPTHHDKYSLQLNGDDGERYYSRDILLVQGVLDGDSISILVNHWPSRRGGQETSEPNRIKAAKINRSLIDSLLDINSQAKIIVMGDLNDDPNNTSITSALKASGDKKEARRSKLYNPTYDFWRRGFGSNAYQDSWSLFDQVIISTSWLNAKSGYEYYKSNIFNKAFLVQKTGQFKGYPLRTFSGNNYQIGYSDHFASYIYITKPI